MSGATSITVRVPMTIRQRGGRKLVVSPDGSTALGPQRARVDSTLIKALARAHRWKRMLDEGRYGSVSGNPPARTARLLRCQAAA